MKKIPSLFMCFALLAFSLTSLAYQTADEAALNPPGAIQIISRPVPQEAADLAIFRFEHLQVFPDTLPSYGIATADIPNLKLGPGFTVTDILQDVETYFFPVMNGNTPVCMIVVLRKSGEDEFVDQFGKFAITECLQKAQSFGEPFELFYAGDGFAAVTASGDCIPLYIDVFYEVPPVGMTQEERLVSQISNYLQARPLSLQSDTVLVSLSEESDIAPNGSITIMESVAPTTAPQPGFIATNRIQNAYPAYYTSYI